MHGQYNEYKGLRAFGEAAEQGSGSVGPTQEPGFQSSPGTSSVVTTRSLPATAVQEQPHERVDDPVPIPVCGPGPVPVGSGTRRRGAHATPPQSIDTSLFVAGGMVERQLTKEATIAAPPAEVFAALSTSEGWKAFLEADAHVELRVGGPMEIYFAPEMEDGLRGSEGCQILSYVPDRMLSYSWNAPPSIPEARAKRTWIVVLLHPMDEGATRLEIHHLGFGEGPVWDETYQYFDRAWGLVADALVAHFAG